MKIVDTLLGEHGIMYVLLDQTEARLDGASSLPEILCATTILEALINSHSMLEEELLDPALEPHLGTKGPMAQMRLEHNEIAKALELISRADNVTECAERVEFALKLIRDHFQKEEAVLFNIVSQLLSDEVQNQLGNAWARSRGVTDS